MAGRSVLKGKKDDVQHKLQTIHDLPCTQGYCQIEKVFKDHQDADEPDRSGCLECQAGIG